MGKNCEYCGSSLSAVPPHVFMVRLVEAARVCGIELSTAFRFLGELSAADNERENLATRETSGRVQ